MLASSVREVMDKISVAADRSKAVVGEREIEAETPRELRRLLSEAIYDVFHSGQEPGRVPTRLRDEGLEARLAAVVPHREIVTLARVRSAVETDDKGGSRILVEREGVRFWIPLAAVRTADPVEGEVAEVTLPSARAGLSPGFFLVDGSRQRRGGQGVLRVYVNVANVDDVVGVWGAALTFLEDHGLPYRAKVLSAPELYPRRDAVVVYLDAEHAQAAPDLAAHVGGLPGVRADVSAFTEELRPGVATAWEPADPHSGRQGLSFGQHRASVLATALVDSAGAPDAGPGTAERTVVEQFRQAGIDPAAPARNLTPSAA
ncbi:T3SS effector HopA1 family protein [Streptomyces sp. NPDC012637]|uniref:T3SS effector HopA1 family protein n=1 Tax=Streptomyces sp. NPDC012637 TaxID=3364842 RepID=UPI0036EB49EB